MSTTIKFDYDDSEIRDTVQRVFSLARNVTRPGPVKDAIVSAAGLWFGFLRRRFDSASRGDGTWPDLAPSTKAKRFRRKFAGRFQRFVRRVVRGQRATRLQELVAGARFLILRDTDELYRSLKPGDRGNYLRITRRGIEAGTTVVHGQYHQNPTRPGRPPRREFLVEPDHQTADHMANKIALGFEKELALARRTRRR